MLSLLAAFVSCHRDFDFPQYDDDEFFSLSKSEEVAYTAAVMINVALTFVIAFVIISYLAFACKCENIQKKAGESSNEHKTFLLSEHRAFLDKAHFENHDENGDSCLNEIPTLDAEPL